MLASAGEYQDSGSLWQTYVSGEAAAVARASDVKSGMKASVNSVPAKPQSVVRKIKNWVKGQIASIRSFWNPDAQVRSGVYGGVSGTAHSSSVPEPSVRPPLSIEEKLKITAETVAAPEREVVSQPGLARRPSGVPSYDISSNDQIPQLKIERESVVPRSQFALDEKLQRVLDDRIIRPLDSPKILGREEIQALLKKLGPVAGPVEKVVIAEFKFKGKVNRDNFDKIAWKLKPEIELDSKTFKNLAKVVPLTGEELQFLSALYLFQQGKQCASAIGLFHGLGQKTEWVAEANYYLAQCSRQLGIETDFFEGAAKILDTQDSHYVPRILAEIDAEIPHEIGERFGEALLKVSENSKIMSSLDARTAGHVAYLLAKFAVSSERFKSGLKWAKAVPSEHPRYHQAQFLLALAEYHSGSKEQALQIEDRIVNNPNLEKESQEFQALVALNAGRMHFQEKNFKEALISFRKVYKNHPLWLQSLTELGWAQLMSDDFEGAIGNMYSIQSPFFREVYKPESYVIRSIGYLNLCQYGDAYRTLSVLEREYRPYLQKMESYLNRTKDVNPELTPYYKTVKSFITSPQKESAKDLDGLPSTVVREMARHRDFTLLQKALNRQVDEIPAYDAVDSQVERQLLAAQAAVNKTRKENDLLRQKLLSAIARKDVREQNDVKIRIEAGINRLNDLFFYVDLYNQAKTGMEAYRKDVVGGAEKRLAKMRSAIEKVLERRLLHMKVDLARILENNELLRYEVFAGSGENIRFQVAGGEIGNRVPASVLPKSKSLQWEFDGEYWEDEVGHYRSSLKNNCPDRARQQANLGGGAN